MQNTPGKGRRMRHFIIEFGIAVCLMTLGTVVFAGEEKSGADMYPGTRFPRLETVDSSGELSRPEYTEDGEGMHYKYRCSDPGLESDYEELLEEKFPRKYINSMGEFDTLTEAGAGQVVFYDGNTRLIPKKSMSGDEDGYILVTIKMPEFVPGSVMITEEGAVYTDAETIRKVQEALNRAGYDCGTPDGIAGNNTNQAIRDYKTDKGLSQNAAITDDLLSALGL